jgi:aminomuconate-semialdehyde/2-hydroxymuconate-6-semialdehyde dehydrogenase
VQEALNFIDGRHAAAAGTGWLDDVDPATGERYARIASSDAHDVDRAVAAAVRAFPGWSTTPVAERSKMLRRIARLIERDLEPLARAESIDSGKPLSVARTVDIPRAVQNFDFFADAITQFSSEAHPTDDVALNYTLRQPLGAVACISPWNLPLYLLTWKIAPALAAGNCVVAKPSEVTPMTAHLLGGLCAEAGLPGGVLNIVQGLGPRAGAPLCAHEDVRAISFTGSTRVGGEIAREAARSFKKASLEMGGKNPTVIFADAD